VESQRIKAPFKKGYSAKPQRTGKQANALAETIAAAYSETKKDNQRLFKTKKDSRKTQNKAKNKKTNRIKPR